MTLMDSDSDLNFNSKISVTSNSSQTLPSKHQWYRRKTNNPTPINMTIPVNILLRCCSHLPPALLIPIPASSKALSWVLWHHCLCLAKVWPMWWRLIRCPWGSTAVMAPHPKNTVKPSLTMCRHCFRPVWLPGPNICKAHRNKAHFYLMFRSQGAPLGDGDSGTLIALLRPGLFSVCSIERVQRTQLKSSTCMMWLRSGLGAHGSPWCLGKSKNGAHIPIYIGRRWGPSEVVRWLRAGTGFVVLSSPSTGGTSFP